MTDVHDRIREYWDRDAVTYDRSPSHAVSDPLEQAAWRDVLVRTLPERGARILDVGAGTGSLSLLAAELGYEVTALDLSPGMLDEARAKSEARGLDIRFVEGPATEPPEGPFDAVIERHLLWTTPDPVAALRAWRAAAPSGRLVLFEAVWGSRAIGNRVRWFVTDLTRRALGVRHDHHAPYPPEVLEQLPLGRMPSPAPLLASVSEAGWDAVRIHRLRDVEWAARQHAPRPLGWLESLPRYAMVADDPH